MKRKENSSNFENRSFLAKDCKLSTAIERISGRWKMQTLYSIYLGETKFSGVKKRLPGISDRILGLRLQELITEGLLMKISKAASSEYRITKSGIALISLMEKLLHWQTTNYKGL